MITRKNPKQCLKNARQEEDIYIGWVTGKTGIGILYETLL